MEIPPAGRADGQSELSSCNAENQSLAQNRRRPQEPRANFPAPHEPPPAMRNGGNARQEDLSSGNSHAPEAAPNGHDRDESASWREVPGANYFYESADRTVQFLRVQRIEFQTPGGDWVIKNGKRYKIFRQYRREGNKWVKGGVKNPKPELVLFRLSELLDDLKAGREIYLVEGEKCVDAAREIGLAATCHAMGGNWRPQYAETLKGANVTILPDHDDKSETWLNKAAPDLLKAGCRVRVLRLPGLENAEDVVNWIERGGTREALELLSAAAPAWTPSAETPLSEDQRKHKKRAAAPSEDALALDFAGHHCDELRYVSFWGKWLKWTGGKWQIENTLAAYDLARDICHGHALGGLRAKTVSTIEQMARSDRRLAATTDQWDADPWLFNTPGGTVDLKTGNLREHRPQDYITKIAGCSPGREGCPMFFAFLNKIFNGDQALIDYLQKFFGYILTGLTIEHAMLFFYGIGANGKGVLASTIAGILGDYHRVAPIDTFTATGFSRHSTDLAGLMGARLGVAHETEEGAKWAEAKLKALTGGDKITAQFMRQDYFDYLPAFKLVITGNHKPGLQTVDEAMRRRLNLIPFSVTIPKADRDPDLAEKLKTEWPGILAWIIAGCLLWQKEGRLNPPQAVADATDEYLESEDALATWIGERCELKASYNDTAEELFKSWKAWAELNREIVGSAKDFGNKLVARPGIARKNLTGKTRAYSGIRAVKVEQQSSFYRDD